MRTQPAPQERPEPLHGIYMHFTQAVAIFISGKLALAMVDTLMTVAPGLQAGINAVLIRINKCPRYDSIFDERLDRLLLHIGQEIDHHLTTTLHHAKDGRSFLLQCTPTRFAFEATSTAFSAFLLHHLRLTFMTRNHIGFVALHFV